MATRKPAAPKRATPRRRAVPPGSAPIPVDDSLDALRDAAAACTRCDLWKPATQTVFGAGPANARILVVGEQPGDAEDLSGVPFVGPSGQMFDRALEELGLDRRRMYVTNAVKHFKFERRGKVRLHKSPIPASSAHAGCGWKANSRASGRTSSCAWARSPRGTSSVPSSD